MPRASREQSEQTAVRVRDCARALLSERGYDGVSLEEVATRAEVTRGAVYHHFASKQGLFVAVLEDVQREVARAVEGAAAGGEDLWDQLVRGCDAFLEASVASGARRVMLVDAPSVLGWDEWRRQDEAASGRLLVDVLAALDTQGDLRPGVAVGAAPLVSGALNEAALWAARQPDPATALGSVRPALRALLAGLRA